MKFVALGVAAEIVVVFENEDARLAARGFAVEVRCRQSADAAANDDQIVGFAGIFGLARRVPECAIAQGCERRRMSQDGCRACPVSAGG